MRWTEARVDALIQELVEENPIAVRPVLRILERRFTEAVPTLAMTLDDRPVLCINQAFLDAHCQTDVDVKALLLHEFLHVVLGHTMRFSEMGRAENIALDAVINAMIYRMCGLSYSLVFFRYYRNQTGIGKLLRLMSRDEVDRYHEALRSNQPPSSFDKLWYSLLYTGNIVADDVLDLARDLEKFGSGLNDDRVLVGNHDGPIKIRSQGMQDAVSDAWRGALQDSLSQMNGSGIWRSPSARGIGAAAYQAIVHADRRPMERWKRLALQALRKALVPDRQSRLRENQDQAYWLPILGPRDRRAFLRAGWSAFIPSAEHLTVQERPLGCANIYLDVSGSMNVEMPLVIGLLNELRSAIRMPFWAFSNVVAPARIVNGQLLAETTGGTSIECVLKHVAQTRPLKAVIVTDGYIESVHPSWMKACSATSISVIVTRDGDAKQLAMAGIPYTQLERVP